MLQCDKLAKLVGRTSTVASTVNIDGRWFVALSVHLCRAKLTTRCRDRRNVANFCKSRFRDTIPDGGTLIFGGT